MPLKARFKGVVSTVLCTVLPANHWYNQMRTMTGRVSNIEVTIQNYEGLSKQLQEEIDNNHFAPILRYERTRAEGDNEPIRHTLDHPVCE